MTEEKGTVLEPMRAAVEKWMPPLATLLAVVQGVQGAWIAPGWDGHRFATVLNNAINEICAALAAPQSSPDPTAAQQRAETPPTGPALEDAYAEGRKDEREEAEADVVPRAWFRAHVTPDSPIDPAQIDIDMAWGDQPEGDGWGPLYLRPLSGGPLPPLPPHDQETLGGYRYWSEKKMLTFARAASSTGPVERAETPQASPEPSEAMVTAYLAAQEAAVHRMDTQPLSSGVRPREACLEGLRAAFATSPSDFDTWTQNPYTKVLHKAIAEDYVPTDEQLAKDSHRLHWLHSEASNNVDGWEWGIWRVKWVNGQVGSIDATLSNFSDLDAAIAASGAGGKE